MDIPILLVGDPRIDGSSLQPYEGVWSVGTVGKAGPLRPGERIRATNISLQKLERAEIDGRLVWRRTVVQKEAGADEELITAIIYMELESLRPIRAIARQPSGTQLGFDYDWDNYVVRPLGAGDDTAPVLSMDLVMLEAAAHEAWMAALPYEEGFTAKIPVLKYSTKGKSLNVWFDNVEDTVSRSVGLIPVRYVLNIYEYYIAFKNQHEGQAQRLDTLGISKDSN